MNSEMYSEIFLYGTIKDSKKVQPNYKEPVVGTFSKYCVGTFSKYQLGIVGQRSLHFTIFCLSSCGEKLGIMNISNRKYQCREWGSVEFLAL